MTRPVHTDPGATSGPIVLGFANVGRGKPVTAVRATMLTIRRQLRRRGKAIVLGLNEIDEGDKTKPSDHKLLRHYFSRRRGWTRTHMTTREPIVLHGLKRLRRHSRSVRGCPGLERQTPGRTWQLTVVPLGKDEPDLAVICGHPPAGARNGDRAPETKKALEERYREMQDAEDELLDQQRKAGRHIITLADRNWRDYKAPGRARIVVNEGPDFITVEAAKGWQFDVVDEGHEPLSIEALHDLLWAVVTFTKENR